MKAILNNGRIIVGVPKFWVRPNGEHSLTYDLLPDEIHYEDGWCDVVQPVIGENQRRGEFFYDEENDMFTWKVVDLTEEEIQRRIEADIEVRRQEELPKALLATSQLIVAERLLNESLPLERVDEFKELFDYPVEGQKYNRDWVLRDKETDELFKIIQPEVIWESWWKISEIPAIVTPFRQPNVINPWVQPSAENPYRLDDMVTHNGFTWISRNNVNTWEPGAVGVDNRIWEKVIE